MPLPCDPSIDGRRSRFPVGASITVEQLADDLHPTLAHLRRTEPISWLPAIGGWLVTEYQSAIQILRDFERFTVDDERFTTGRVVGPSMLSTDGVDHQGHREPFEAMFRRASVVAITDSIVATCRDLIDGFRTDGEAELRTRYAAPLAVSVIARFLGFHDQDGPIEAQIAGDERLLALYRTIVDTVVGLGTGTSEPGDADAAMADLREMITEAAARNDRLVALAENGTVSDALLSDVAVILFGAIETCEGMTANAIGHVLGSDNASVAAAVRAGTADLDRVVNESLRLEPAAAVVDRYATADVVVDTRQGPVAIASGDLVEVSLAGANRDGTMYEEPDRFDPQRARIGQHLSFARGPHVCLGLHLAKLQTATALRVLLTELPAASLDQARSTPPRGHIFRKPELVTASW